MKIAIVTALAGNKDRFSNPSIIHKDVDYFAFVENPQKSIWTELPLLKFSLDERFQNRRNAKIYKILPFIFLPDYDYYFWVDASHDVIEEPTSIISKYLKENDYAVFRHRERDCAYQEINELKKLNYDHSELLIQQENLYRATKFPENYGLFELSGFVMRNTQSSRTLALRWWELICKYSSRDQISFPFVLWTLNQKVSILPGAINGGLYTNTIITQTRPHGH